MEIIHIELSRIIIPINNLFFDYMFLRYCKISHQNVISTNSFQKGHPLALILRGNFVQNTVK